MSHRKKNVAEMGKMLTIRPRLQLSCILASKCLWRRKWKLEEAQNFLPEPKQINNKLVKGIFAFLSHKISSISLEGLEKKHESYFKSKTKTFIILQCPPLNRITLGQHKRDNNNRMNQLTDVFCVLLRYRWDSNLRLQ